MTDDATTYPGREPLARRMTADAWDRVIGRFGFAVDRRIEGSAHAFAVRSSVPHGTITAIDSNEAKTVPGVLAVITGPDVRVDPSVATTHGETRQDQPVLAFDKVRYVGEPVALVVAETRTAAEDAAALVDVEIAELDLVVDHELAGQPGAPVLHEAWPDNECGTWTLRHGDAEAAMARAEVVHRATYRSPAANHAPMEPHVATAAWLPDGRLEVWTSTQAPYPVRRRLAEIFGLAEDRVRVCVDPLGGGFGSKLDLRLEALVALGSRAVRRPVRMELRRDEVFVTSAKHAATVTITTGADRDGTLRARIVDIVYNGGAYALSTPRSTRTGMIRSPGPYAIPDVLCRVVGRYTNTVPAGPFRGAMTGQVCWAHESATDELAALLGMDPLELRMRNVLRDGDLFATGEAMHGMRYRELVDAAAKGVDWDADAGPTRPELARGKGMAVVLKSTRTPSRSEAHIVLDATGRVTVRTSTVEMGQGAHASMAQLAAARLEMPADDVLVSTIDTHRTPFDTTTSSSRSTLTMGTAVERAADDLRRRIDELATAGRPGTAAPTHSNGAVTVALPEPTVLRYEDLLAGAGLDELVGTGCYQSPPGAGEMDPETTQGMHTVSWHQGAVAVEVEVDVETGRVRVLRAHGASFAGRAVDERRIRKQTEGGMIFGLGQVLMEEVVYDDGQVMNPNLSDYQIPSILDAPERVGSTVLTDPDPDAHPHGVGENTVPPMAPAIANAICAATGVRIRDLPLTPEKVLRAIHEPAVRTP
ncbi:MAG: xanthine dehydrogenase family protein molybdopterin-binding subunit [Streptosporangiales bacterium]|nr:xanthine dehydrogenase family protein molybdopterin-binding subunit [Streptosporangiales bacterium]MBO0889291.1 xanthine dehydrogenase family protein molybdopterin-binding subunit [Acidothermales bacterium]